MALVASHRAIVETTALETTTRETETLGTSALDPSTLEATTTLETTALEIETTALEIETTALETTTALEAPEKQDGAEPADAEEVEAALDEVLAAQMGTLPLTEGEFAEDGAALDLRHPRTEFQAGVVRLRQPDEFVCTKCFLMKRRELLVNADRAMCRDCAA